MTIDFYYMAASAPCRTVLLVAKALKLELNLITLNLQNGEHLKPEFLKINPQHTIPTLVDNGFAIWESRAIVSYLVNQYGKGSSLYPQEAKARAVVDQRLYFDLDLYSKFGDYFYPQLMAGAPADSAKLTKLEEQLKHLDTFLEGQKYVAGSNLTIADMSLLATVSTFEASDVNFLKFNNIKKWYETMKAAPGYDVNQAGVEQLKQFASSKQSA